MREPYFWSANLDPRSREAAPMTRLLLSPLAWIYAKVTARRLAKVRPQSVDAKVICVGNVSAGGVGKSPVVAYLRNQLSAQTGLRVVTLSRGYKGQLTGPLRVDPEVHTANDVGDEPLMLAHKGESWIGKDRLTAGTAMAGDGVDIIVMDDGHQNPALAKDLSLVVVDSHRAFGNGFVIPKGPLREPVEVSLKRADAIIVLGDGDLPAPVRESGKPVLRAHLQVGSAPPKGRYVGFAGIGHPGKFFDTLKTLDIELVETVPFGDHHVYTRSDMTYLRNLASSRDATLITTEKDFIRLGAEDRADIAMLPVEIVFDAPEALANVLEPVLATAKDGAS